LHWSYIGENYTELEKYKEARAILNNPSLYFGIQTWAHFGSLWYIACVESLLKADIFFFISSIATIVFTILVSVLLVYLIKAGKNLYKLSEILKSSYNDSEEFITDLRDRLEENIVFRMFFPPLRKRRNSKR